jgi:alpha-beta hydrolase superfamily lysophospholipase
MRMMASIREWKLRNRILLSVLVVVAAVAIGSRVASGSHQGTQYWFKDRAYHFQALRALQYAPFKAADANEVLVAVSNTTEGDVDSWYGSWYQMAQTVERMGNSYQDGIDKAHALLRASNYYRTAEFFLHGDDPRRKDTWKRHSERFETALDLLGVKRDHLRVPYEGKELNAVFYPAKEPPDLKQPLIVGFNGWDGAITETYHRLVSPGNRRGYNVLVYEGPGQGSVLRDQGLRFTPEWHKPNSAVLDHFINRYGKPSKIVLFGESLGAVLVMRAAAEDKRVDGVVAFGVMYDALDVSMHKVPGIIKWLYESGHRKTLNFAMRQAAKSDAVVAWGLGHAAWTMGIEDETGSLDALKQYHVRGAVDKITCDVLLMHGQNDHFGIISDQMGKTKRGLKNARSVTDVVFKKGEGGEEHCQIGAMLQMQAELFQWIDAKFKP